MGLLVCLLGANGCGGDASSDGGDDAVDSGRIGHLSIQASLAVPTSSSMSQLEIDPSLLMIENQSEAPALIVGEEGEGVVTVRYKKVTETPQSGVKIHCEDLSGHIIGEPCKTQADGTCLILGLKKEQITAGVIVVSEDAQAPLHDFVQLDEKEVDKLGQTAALATTTPPISSQLNTKSEMAYGVLKTKDYGCNGDLGRCDSSLDRKCLKEVMQAVVGDDEPSNDDLGGYAEASFQAFAKVIQNSTKGGRSPSDFLKSALGGDTKSFTEVVGDKVAGVPVDEALKNFGTMLKTIRESYCTQSPGLKAVWKEVKEESKDFDPKAVAKVMKGFTPTEIDNYDAAQFSAFAKGLPQLDNGFKSIGSSEEMQRGFVEMFRNGAFTQTAQVPQAMAFMMATKPSDGDFSKFDPSHAAQAATNMFLEFTYQGGSASTDPRTMQKKFENVLGNPTYQQAAASGGSAANHDVVNAFISKGEKFNPDSFTSNIKSSAGGSCKTGQDCLPGNTCNNSVCISLSTKIEQACSSSQDCDDITACASSTGNDKGGKCISKAVVPPGYYVYNKKGKALPRDAKGSAFSGSVGAECGTGMAPCGSDSRGCSDTVHGICLPPMTSTTFKLAPFSRCSRDDDCLSRQCVMNGPTPMCSALNASQLSEMNRANKDAGKNSPSRSDIGTRMVGQPCRVALNCATFYCEAAVCKAAPTAFQTANQNSTLKSNGASCSYSGECISGYCLGSPKVCSAAPLTTPTTSSGRTSPSGLPAGAYCNLSSGAQCVSRSCNMQQLVCR